LQERIPILMYHEVADPGAIDELARKIQRGYLLARDDFERQLRMLAAAGYSTVSLDALSEARKAPTDMGSRPIIITFDDGFAGNYRHAFPMLQQYGFTATFFVVSNKMGDPNMLQWRELDEMARHGMTIGSHTANHCLLSTLDEHRTRSELAESKQRIEQQLGVSVRYLSLPSGDSNRWYPRVAKECGYRGGCSSRLGLNDANTDHWFWRRIAVKRTMRAEYLQRLVAGDLQTWVKARAWALAKQTIATGLGKKNYERLYVRLFGVEEQDRTLQP